MSTGALEKMLPLADGKYRFEFTFYEEAVNPEVYMSFLRIDAEIYRRRKD